MEKIAGLRDGPLGVSLGRGTLEVSVGERARIYSTGEAICPADAFANSKWDVVVGERVLIRQSQPEYEWSASLWYCNMASFRIPYLQTNPLLDIEHSAEVTAESVRSE
jgi:hypothetical protein